MCLQKIIWKAPEEPRTIWSINDHYNSKDRCLSRLKKRGGGRVLGGVDPEHGLGLRQTRRVVDLADALLVAALAQRQPRRAGVRRGHPSAYGPSHYRVPGERLAAWLSRGMGMMWPPMGFLGSAANMEPRLPLVHERARI